MDIYANKYKKDVEMRQTGDNLYQTVVEVMNGGGDIESVSVKVLGEK